MMELVIIRHGESLADIDGRHEGRADYSLTDRGREQAGKVAKWLSERFTFDAVYSSPLKRAKETAEIICDATGNEITFNEELLEWNNGVLAGMLREEAIAKYPEPVGGRKYFQTILEGESMLDLRCRAEHFLADLLYPDINNQEKKTIGIVSHGGLITMLYRSFLNLPIDTNVWLASGDTGIHVWRISGDKKVIVYTNLQEHVR